jgi:2-acylglycerol O-acyltransferase 2
LAHAARGGAWNSFIYNENMCGYVAESLLHAPLFRTWFVQLMGGLKSASKEGLLAAMKRKESIGLIPGGFHEASVSCAGADRVFLKDRKGFVVYALRHGYSLTPVYTFGESETYSQPQGMYKLRFALNDWKLPAILPFGRWWCPLLPRTNVELHTVGGTPLQLPKIDKPTAEDVDFWHSKYVQHLKAHFDLHKGNFGVASGSHKRELEIW